MILSVRFCHFIPFRFFLEHKKKTLQTCITHCKMSLSFCSLNGFCSICCFYSNGFVFCLQVQPGVNIESGLCSRPASSTPLIPAETILPPPSTHVRPKSQRTLSRPLLFENEKVSLAFIALLHISVSNMSAGFQIYHTPKT